MNKDVAKVISKVILAERTVRIKLLGDSITHGEGGTGFKQDGEPIVAGFARNKDGYCWANLFKEYIIFIANIPASQENEKDGADYWRIFHMNDVNDLYMKASTVCNFPFISLYSKFVEYCEFKDITVDSLLADGLHPNDKGHHVMFKLILKELGVA